MQRACLLSIALFTAFVCGASPAPTPPAAYSRDFWLHQIALTHTGMKQQDVEKYLPYRTEDTEQAVKIGYTLTYGLDENWSITVTYDTSGYTPVNNPYNVMHMFNDRLLKPPRLFRHPNQLTPGFPFVQPRGSLQTHG